MLHQGWWSEDDRPKSLIRNLTGEVVKSTIAIAFKAKDAVVVAADRQGSVGDGTTRDISKVFRLGPKALIAMASNDYAWTTDLVGRIREIQGSDAVSKVRAGTESYDDYVLQRFSNKYPDFMEYAGVLGVWDNGPKIFEFQSKSTLREEVEQGFVITGEARRSAEPLVRQANILMTLAWSGEPSAHGLERTWPRFSAKLIAQFSAMLLIALPAIESSVSYGVNIFRIDKNGIYEYGLVDLFPEYPHNRWQRMLETAMQEITPKDIIALDRELGLIPAKLRAVFYAFAEENQSW